MLLLATGALELANYLTTANAKGSEAGRVIEVDWLEQPKEILYNQQIYGYASLVELTDSTPFLTASQSKVNVGVIANNCYAFGTRVQINGKNYTVEDRMSKVYGCEVWDIWMPTRQQALNWGVQYLEIFILDN